MVIILIAQESLRVLRDLRASKPNQVRHRTTHHRLSLRHCIRSPIPLLGIIFGQLIDDFNSESCTAETSFSPEVQASYQSEVNGKILYVLYLAIAQFGFMYIQLVCWSLGGARLAQRLTNVLSQTFGGE